MSLSANTQDRVAVIEQLLAEAQTFRRSSCCPPARSGIDFVEGRLRRRPYNNSSVHVSDEPVPLMPIVLFIYIF